MAAYSVKVKEVHLVSIKVNLSREQEKLSLVTKLGLIRELAEREHSNTDLKELEYSNTLSPAYWSIEKIR